MECKNKVREIRIQHNITQEALAFACRVTRQTIFAIEKEKFIPSVKLALEIANALSVPVDELFWLEKVEKEEQ